jgi:hypothetical protein
MSARGTFDVALEGAVFACVQVHPGHEQAFDDWYGLDHFYSGGVLGPAVLSGKRWFADRRLRESRFVSDDCLHPDPRAGNHLAAYWLTTGGLNGFFSWVRPQLALLRAQGRMFEARSHVIVDGYRAAWALAHSASSPVNPIAALDHGFGGLFVSYGEPAGASPAPAASLPQHSLGIVFAPAAGSLDHDAVQTPPGAPGLAFPTASGAAVMTMLFLPARPPTDIAWSRRIAVELARASGTAPLWGAGFYPIEAGSGSHVARMG